MVYTGVYDLGKTIWLLCLMQDEINVLCKKRWTTQRAVVRPNVEDFEKGKSYVNVDINITFKAKMKVFKDDLIDTD